VSRFLRAEFVRWVLLGVAMVVLVAFLVAQQQSAGVTYGDSPARDTLDAAEPAVTLPSVEELTALVDASPVVRLPGAVATWDAPRVDAVIGDADVRILVTPPGLDKDQRRQVYDVDNVTVRVLGTQVTGGALESMPDSLAGWRTRLATGDVTEQLIPLIARLLDQPEPPEVELPGYRAPTDAELSTVVSDLRSHGVHVAAGADFTTVPAQAAAAAFPDHDPLVVVLPTQPPGEPLPAYGPALADAFPDTPILVMYGAWVEYHGPHADEFGELAAVSFYSQYGSVLSRDHYPQENVLAVYLNRVTDIRYSGLFDRPLPYQPFDPLRMALPALPWIFMVCVLGFLALSMRPLVRGVVEPRMQQAFGGGQRRRVGVRGVAAHLAGLSALAVEMSMVTDRGSDPALARGISHLQAARTALDDQLPHRHVRRLLADAEAELDEAARKVGLDFLRPRHYLQEWLA